MVGRVVLPIKLTFDSDNVTWRMRKFLRCRWRAKVLNKPLPLDARRAYSRDPVEKGLCKFQILRW
jgi:hypothetical protein